MKGAIGGFLSKIGFDSKTDATKPAAQRVETASTEPSQDPTLYFLLRNVRSKLQRTIFFQSSPEAYTEHHDVKILVSSFNVNGKKPPEGVSLKPLIGAATDAAAVRPGIIAVGFQEIVPLSASNVIVGSALTNIRAWDRLIAMELNGEAWANKHFDEKGQPGPSGSQAQELPKGDEAVYLQVASKQLVGIYSSIWVHKDLLPFVKGVQAAVVSTGFGGYLGNKGAVAVRMFIFDSPVCFVNAHLSSGSKEGDESKRNADVAEILQRCDFAAAAQYGDQIMTTASATMLGLGHWGSMKAIEDHSSAIWLGDLNYRLNLPPGFSDEDTIKAIRLGRLGSLLEADQLCREMAANRVFNGWKEAKVSFAPTFKFKLGTHSYLGESIGDVPDADDTEEDPAEAQKKRTPAWCDRVLSRGSQLNQASYFRGEVTASDHKPVAAEFLMQAKHYNRRKVDDLLSAAGRKSEIMQASMRPRPSLSPNLVTIGDLKFGEERKFSVTLSNSGPVEGIFHFIPPPNSDYNNDDPTPSLPAWLKAWPDEGVVPPGGSVEIELRVCVDGGPDGASAGLAVATNDYLDAIVILRVEDGSDMFLSLTGTYRKSAWLGIPLDSVIGADSGPAQSAAVPRQISALASILDTAAALAAPGLFVRSVEAVLSSSQGAEGAGDLLVAGQAVSRSTRRSLLRRLQPLVEVLEQPGCILPEALDPHQAAALLLVMLGELPKALLPNMAIVLIEAAIEAGQLPDSAMVPDLLLTDVMTPIELETLKTILKLMNKVAASPTADVRTKDLVGLLSGCLLSPLPTHAPAESRARRERALRALLD